MAKTAFDDGYIVVSVRHVMEKPDGSLYYHRRVPADLQRHYGGKEFIRESLQTKTPAVAAKKARKLAAEHDALWKHLRASNAKELGLTTQQTRDGAAALLKSLDIEPGEGGGGDPHSLVADRIDDHLTLKHGWDYLEARHSDDPKEFEELLSPVEHEAIKVAFEKPGTERHLLSDARDLYLSRKDKGPRFARDTKRAVGHVIDAVGDLPLHLYTRKQARDVVDFLSGQGNTTATVRRRLRTINAVFNYGIREFDLKDAKNQFEKLEIKGEGRDASKREAFTVEELRLIAKACQKADDDVRHIIALQLDTGARAAEIIGLRVEDVFVDHEVPHLWIREYVELGRTLKTRNSNRKVPLVGWALWGARRALENAARPKGWLFPRYAADGLIKADHASATLNKWLKSVTATEKTTHSFRHAMRDRLRDVGAPPEVQDEIGGWGAKSIGQSYGEGYALRMKHEWLLKVAESI